MALLDDLLTWSTASLKPWQQDAVRRLFQNALTREGLDDLYAMLKSANGLPDPQNRQPEPLAKHHVPTTAANGSAAILVELRKLQNVNRLAPGQALKFSKTGLTIVYGGNGAGKSGYARVMKKACRSRDSAEDVRPNALEKHAGVAIPSAEFIVELDGKPVTLAWKKNQPSPQELSTVAVFDTHCARAYLDQRQEVAYLPFGLDIIENFAQVVLPELTAKLAAETGAISTSKDAFNHLLGPTKVGALIAALGKNTRLEDVEALAQILDAEKLRVEELTKMLKEHDPKAKATYLRLAGSRVKALKEKIAAAALWVSPEAVQKLKGLDSETEAAIGAETVAANAFRAGEQLLPGTGEAVWRELFEAARQFSTNIAYPEHEFPHTENAACCVLCQQPLSGEAAERMRRFEAFVQANTAKVAKEKREARGIAESKVEKANLEVSVETALAEELGNLDTAVLPEIDAYMRIIEVRRAWMLQSLRAHSWEGDPGFTIDPCARLQALVDRLANDEKAYEKATDDKQRQGMENELAELQARAALTAVKQPVLDLVSRFKTKALLEKCKDDLKTKPVSDKAKELASNAVTEPLRKALKQEFETLGVAHMMPRLDESVEKGKMKHKLELNLEVQAELRDILSEGEQRAIAIGAFLAELRTAGHAGGIIFDDPVSSLDHFRRQKVARRLVEEANARQVIIFTHDTAFLAELQELITLSKVPSLVHYLEWEGQHAGRIADGLPWHHKSYKDRIDKLQQAHAKLANPWPAYPNEAESAEMRRLYNLLRATIERVVQDVVFNGVVVRYRDWIKVGGGHLEDVVGFTAGECSEIERLHKVCSDVIDAHDPASGRNGPVPTAADFGQHLSELLGVVQTIKDRRSNAKAAKGAAAAGAAV